MNIEFYTFDKKYNSTKQPTLKSGTEYDCYLKTSSSIVSPTIELNMGLTVNPSAWNYAYISSYSRYYWVTEWTFSGSSWFASLNVDVLASWKPYIGDTNMYVYRSSAEKNGAIADLKYPTTSQITYTRNGTTTYSAYDFADGSYIIGIYGQNAGDGSISYYGFTASDFATFVNQLFVNIVGDSTIWNELGEGIRNSLFDISAYIKSCRWYPITITTFDIATYPSVSSIKIGSIGISCTARYMGGGGSIAVTVPQTLDTIVIDRHPQASTRGNYCNLKPFSRYRLYALPFGIFDLDGVYLSQASYLHMNATVDIITGLGVLTVTCGSGILETSSDIFVMTASCQYGVDIPISSASVNYQGIGEFGAGLLNTFMGNIFGGFAGMVKGATDLLVPSMDNVLNKNGSMVNFNFKYNGLYETFFTIADDDNATNGRPLFAKRYPKNISGYIEGDSSNFSCPATDSEQTEIRRFIDNGFYYE